MVACSFAKSAVIACVEQCYCCHFFATFFLENAHTPGTQYVGPQEYLHAVSMLHLPCKQPRIHVT